MPIILNGAVRNNFRLGNLTPDRIFMGNELVWPAFTPAPVQITATGNYTYDIPPNCRFIDVVLVGGGGGGQASLTLFAYGAPGGPGGWAGATLKRGVDIPWSVTQITGRVGIGGPGGPGPSISPGFPGQSSTATCTGFSLEGAQGDGGILAVGSQAATRGKGPGNFTWNGILYVGGADNTANSQDGKAPGGAGNGSAQFSSGYTGARGQAWFRAY
ncbi:hypothetical protein SEA_NOTHINGSPECIAL_7 [Mycobacterium phage NothingSpecial]|nr:hypothetical protein SEA_NOTHINGSPECIAL_7 [Mycobacterium phage NothingSpecial]